MSKYLASTGSEAITTAVERLHKQPVSAARIGGLTCSSRFSFTQKETEELICCDVHKRIVSKDICCTAT